MTMAAAGTWYEINDQPADQPCRARFVDIMHAMDPRYRGLTAAQLASWMDPAQGIYANDPIQAFGWFADGAGKDQPTSMEIALACRYDRNKNRAFWVMLGWLAPNLGRGTQPNSSLTPTEVADVLETVYSQLVGWMNSLTPSNPTSGLIIAVRPHTMQTPYIAKLHEQAYVGAIAEEPVGSYLALINRQRTSVDSTILEMKITTAP